jgi:arginase
MQTKPIALIGVPSSAGARRIGQEAAPASVRAAGLIERLRSSDLDVVDFGDVPQAVFSPDIENPKQQNLGKLLGVLKDVSDAVDKAVAAGRFPLVIGGDCTISIGILASLTRHFENVGMMYVDGDVDLNTPDTTPSGIFDGMVIAHILGWGVEEISRIGTRFPLLAGKNLSLFGFNAASGSIDDAELERLGKIEAAQYPLESIKGRVLQAAQTALRELEKRAENILVHFDVDVVDFNDFPAADVPHRPGISLREARDALAVFVKSPRAAGLVVTEFNVTRDPDGKLAHRLVDVIAGALDLTS